MSQFQYKYGDKPLEGYTIQRAAGRGGFGEVYYALSDSGRQVALKVVQNYEQTELRGIGQCMNLKSPHLVTIFDVKYNDENKPFVIMEYVSGPSLRDLLNESPSGLGEQKTAFFMREIAKGLSYLHDCGIVHRDLKPGNIFYENGYVKIGDYGLSKLINSSANSQQTITVGTVHYMAPEIGAGCYDRSIDIYAFGIMLYEMLTGQVPYFGASPGEILMKHMTVEPDLSLINEPFKTAIGKALAKDPKIRYQTVQQMVEDVFGAEHIRNSVSQFSPESLSMIAEQAARKAGISGSPADSPGIYADMPSPKPNQPKDRIDERLDMIEERMTQVGRQIGKTGERVASHVAKVSERFGAGVGKATTRISQKFNKNTEFTPEQVKTLQNKDPLSKSQRTVLGLITVLSVSFGTGLLGANSLGQGRAEYVFGYGSLAFLMIYGLMAGVSIARYKLLHQMEKSPVRNVLTALCGTAFCLLTSGWLFADAPFGDNMGGTYIVVAIILALNNLWTDMNPYRKERIALGDAVGAGFVAWLGASFLHGESILACGVLAGFALLIQIISPYIPHENRNEQERVIGDKVQEEKEVENDWFGNKEAAVKKAKQNAAQAKAAAVAKKEAKQTSKAAWAAQTNSITKTRLPQYVQIIWLCATMILLGLGLMLLISTGFARFQDDEFAFVISFGVGSLVLSIFTLVRTFTKTFISWYRYLIKPMILFVCFESVLASGIFMGNVRMADEEYIVALGFIIFPVIFFLVTLSMPSRVIESTFNQKASMARSVSMYSGAVSPYKRIWAMLLALIPIPGLHRFYVGKVGTAILWMCTFGLFGIGQIIDIICILTGSFTDRSGLPLTVWEDFDELNHMTDSGNAIPVGGVSPFKRLWALLLAFLPVCGLQRFYVGKFGTGILWLLTGGLCGIGQMIDIIRILLGNFTDNKGLRVVIWESEEEWNAQKQVANKWADKTKDKKNEYVNPFSQHAAAQEQRTVKDDQSPAMETPNTENAQAQPAPASNYPNSWVPPIKQFHPFAFLLGAIGNIFILLAFIAGLFIAFHVPSIFAAGIPDASIADELNKALGSNWPRILDNISRMIGMILLIVGAMFIALSRRHQGPAHIIRAIVSLILLLLSTLVLAEAIPGTYSGEMLNMIKMEQFGDALDMFMNQIFTEELFTSMFMFIVAFVVMVWPAKKIQQELPATLPDGEEVTA